MSSARRWEVAQIDLFQPLQELQRNSNAAGVYVVFWWKNLPLGHAKITAAELPLNPAALRRVAAAAISPAVGDYCLPCGFKARLPVHYKVSVKQAPPTLEALATLVDPLQALPVADQPDESVSISVIICTRARPKQLRTCLAAFSQVNDSPLEIIVVDNAPSNNETQMVAEQFPGVTYCREPLAGLSRARNCGILKSSGDIIAFADDDVVVHRDWLSTVRRVLSKKTVYAMTGLVLAAELETESQIRFESDFGFNAGYRPIVFDLSFFQSMVNRGVPVWCLGAGANMAFRREVFRSVGLFDIRLGAGSAGCSEDSEMWYRMLAAGMTIAYEPRAVVWHWHREAHNSFRSQIRQYMRGHVVALIIQFEKHGHWGNIRRLYTSLPHHYLKRAKRLLRSGDWSLLANELFACVWGIVTYLGYLLSGRFKKAGKSVC